MTLDKDEIIFKEIKHRNFLPFRQEDWARLLFIPFMIFGLYIFFKNQDYFGLLFAIPNLIILYNLTIRWMKIIRTKYFLTNKRLIIFNTKKEEIEYSFCYSDFPKMTLRENAYNYGYIIVGELEELIEGPDTPFRFPVRTGMNLKDHKIVIDNIPNVRHTYNLILEKSKTSIHNL
ncbi:hypothetical protein [Tenacibaculum crassostreae]|uniref:hypothetical protein n=1 Tax=Tenacibaculum crassostreae TaxID=502683 RepID=UPI003893A693